MNSIANEQDVKSANSRTTEEPELLTHPMQPVVRDKLGCFRFKENKIVDYLFKSGKLDLNDIARMSFADEDHRQIAQLLGYSVSGYGDLNYVDEDEWERAFAAQAACEAANRERNSDSIPLHPKGPSCGEAVAWFYPQYDQHTNQPKYVKYDSPRRDGWGKVLPGQYAAVEAAMRVAAPTGDEGK